MEQGLVSRLAFDSWCLPIELEPVVLSENSYARQKELQTGRN